MFSNKIYQLTELNAKRTNLKDKIKLSQGLT